MQRFPQYLHRPYRLLWFEMDEIYIMIFVYTLAMIFSLWLLLVMPLVVLAFRIEKRRRPRGFFRHFWYRLGILEFRGYPSYFKKEFKE